MMHKNVREETTETDLTGQVLHRQEQQQITELRKSSSSCRYLSRKVPKVGQLELLIQGKEKLSSALSHHSFIIFGYLQSLFNLAES